MPLRLAISAAIFKTSTARSLPSKASQDALDRAHFSLGCQHRRLGMADDRFEHRSQLRPRPFGPFASLSQDHQVRLCAAVEDDIGDDAFHIFGFADHAGRIATSLGFCQRRLPILGQMFAERRQRPESGLGAGR